MVKMISKLTKLKRLHFMRFPEEEFKEIAQQYRKGKYVRENRSCPLGYRLSSNA